MTAEANYNRTPDFCARFYLNSIPDFFFYVDKDKKVTDVIGPGASEKFKSIWMGKHISSVKDDVTNKLFKHSMHSMSWFNDPDVQDNIKKKRELEISINRVAFRIDNPEKEDNIQDLKNHLQILLNKYQDVTRFLNFKRAADFGDDTTEEYFGITKVHNHVSWDSRHDKYEFFKSKN